MFRRTEECENGSGTVAIATMELEQIRNELDLYKRAFAEIQTVAQATSNGDFSSRIVHWGEFGELSLVLAHLNHSYDMADAFVRESTASLEAAMNKDYHRKFLTQGILGDFGKGAEIINAASDAMQKTEIERVAQLNELADQFSHLVLQTISNLSSAAEQTSQSSLDLMEHARNNQAKAAMVTTAAEQAAINVQAVASASQELSASVQEIAQQVNLSSERMSSAATDVEATTNKVTELSNASKTIGQIVKLIYDIASQTNMLALNATIEAARAGTAGKGFAVVASEVKSLALQTSDATDDISRQVDDIQDKTGQSVTAIAGIHTAIRALDEIAATIASAAEEQSSATIEITRNIQKASEVTDQVSGNIVDVNNTASHTLACAEELQGAARTMEQQMGELQQQAQDFVANIRTL